MKTASTQTLRVLTFAELGVGQGLSQTVQRPPQQAQVADVEVHGAVKLRVGEAGLLVGFHIFLQVPSDLGQSLALRRWVRLADLLEASLASLVCLQDVSDLLQGRLDIGEHPREDCRGDAHVTYTQTKFIVNE